MGGGLLAVGLLVMTAQMITEQRTHFARANALMDLRLKVMRAYLHLNDTVPGASGRAAALLDLDEATGLAAMLVTGGNSKHGLRLVPFDAPDDRRRADELVRLMGELRARAQERAVLPAVTAAPDPLDRVVNDVRRVGEQLESLVESRLAADHEQSKRRFVTMLAIWGCVIVASALALLQRERRRQRAEDALQSTVEALETRVAERTQQLSTVHEQLNVELGEITRARTALRESEAHLRQLSGRLLMEQEAERSRISRDLHDELGHALMLVKLRLRAIKSALRHDLDEAGEIVEILLPFIDQVIQSVRRLSKDLRPGALEDLGLSAALRWLVDNANDTNLASVMALTVDLDAALAREAHVVVYRIVQEALTNVKKHAGAKLVNVTFDRGDDGLTLIVQDDGGGFDVREAGMRPPSSEGGMGLATMHERARILGGRLLVESEPGRGTRLTVNIPLATGEG